MKKTIRLTEGDLKRIIKESVKRVLREEGEESFEDWKLKHYNYMQNKDNYPDYETHSKDHTSQYMYDKALDAENLEDYDEKMAKRANFLRMRAKNAQNLHQQTTPLSHGKSFGAAEYVDGGDPSLLNFNEE